VVAHPTLNKVRTATAPTQPEANVGKIAFAFAISFTCSAASVAQRSREQPSVFDHVHQSALFVLRCRMSAFGGKADMAIAPQNVRF
jgi:hypothetical protein